MGQELGFTLGLASGNFLSTAAKAEGAVGSLITKALALPGLGVAIGGLVGSVSSLHAIIENTFAQFEKGAGLAGLSKQTGESVANLFSLEKGFKAVHLSADMVGPALFQMQKALGGFSEFGEPTKDLFAAMGLSVGELKKASAPEQIERISKALAGLSRDEAAMASSKIFGRSAGRDMLQLGRSGDEFAQALKAAAPQAEIMAKNAGAFEKIEQSLGRMKGKTQGLFLGLAEGAAPGVQAALDTINKMDLTGLGQKIGHVIAGLGQAIATGRLSEVIELSMKAGIEGGSNFMIEQIALWSTKIQEAFGDKQKPGILKKAGGVGLGLLGVWDLVGEKLGVPGAKELAEKRIDAANKIFTEEGFEGVIGGMAEGFKPGGSNRFTKPLNDLIAKLASDALAKTQGGDLFKVGGNSLGGLLKEKEIRSKQDVNALERIGLVRFGAGAGADYAQQTARNTGSMIGLLDRVNAALERMERNNGGVKDAFANLA